MTRKRKYFDWRIYFLFALAFLIPAAFMYSVTTTPVPSTASGLAIGCSVVAAITILVWRVAREGIYSDSAGITIRWIFGRRRKLRWEEIAKIEDGLSKTEFPLSFRTHSGELIQSSLRWRGGILIGSVSPTLGRKAYVRLVDSMRQSLADQTGADETA